MQQTGGRAAGAIGKEEADGRESCQHPLPEPSSLSLILLQGQPPWLQVVRGFEASSSFPLPLRVAAEADCTVEANTSVCPLGHGNTAMAA